MVNDGSGVFAEFTVTISGQKSEMRSLAISAGDIYPAFNKTVYEYTIIVPFNTNSIIFTPNVEYGIIKINGVLSINNATKTVVLSDNTTNVTVQIIQSNRDTVVYNITVIKEMPCELNITGSNLKLKSGVLSGTVNYTLTNKSLDSEADIFVAIYEGNRLVYFSSGERRQYAIGETQLSFDGISTDNATSDNYTIKVFMWDSIVGQKALAAPAVYEW
jgi:hypothetical protein